MTMKPNRAVISGVYCIAALMVIMPLSELTLRVWPIRIGETSWRFGASGLFSSALLLPLLGLIVAGAVAFLSGNRTLVRVLAGFTAAAAALLVLASGLFALDAVQMRSNVVPEAKTAFDVASAQALIKFLLFGGVGLLLAIGSWISTSYPPGRQPRNAPDPADVLVRRPDDLTPEAPTISATGRTAGNTV
jgi:hypothetical protein